MKILASLLIATCVLLSTVQAGISPRLDSLRTRAFEQIDVPSGGSGRITTAVGNAAINRAISEVCAKAPALEKFDTLYVDSIVEGATLPSNFDRAKSAEMIWDDTNVEGVLTTFRLPMLPITGDSQFIDKPTLDQLQQAGDNPLSVVRYRTFGGRLKVFPKWNRADSATIVLEYYAQDSLLQANASQTSIEAKWLNAVINMAASLLSAKRNNFEDAAYYLNLFRSDVGLPPVAREEYMEK